MTGSQNMSLPASEASSRGWEAVSVPTQGWGRGMAGRIENPLFTSSGAFWSEELPAALKPSWAPGGRESVLRKNEPGEACEGQGGPRAAAQGFGRLTIHCSHGWSMGKSHGRLPASKSRLSERPMEATALCLSLGDREGQGADPGSWSSQCQS